MATVRMTLDPAQEEQFNQAINSHQPRISCDESTMAHDAVFYGEVAARRYLTYNLLEPLRFKARTKFLVRFEQNLPIGFQSPRKPVTERYFSSSEPVVIFPTPRT